MSQAPDNNNSTNSDIDGGSTTTTTSSTKPFAIPSPKDSAKDRISISSPLPPPSSSSSSSPISSRPPMRTGRSLSGSSPSQLSLVQLLSSTSSSPPTVSSIDNFTIAIIGAPAVGKSCISTQFAQHDFNYDYIPTICEDVFMKKIKVDDRIAHLEIVDTGGDDTYKRTRENVLRRADGFLIVFDVSQRNSMKKIDSFRKAIHDANQHRADASSSRAAAAAAAAGGSPRPPQAENTSLVNDMSAPTKSSLTSSSGSFTGGGGVASSMIAMMSLSQQQRSFTRHMLPVLVVGNKCDTEKQQRQVTVKEAKQFVEGITELPYMEVSALRRHNVDECFEALVRAIRKHQAECLAAAAAAAAAAATAATAPIGGSCGICSGSPYHGSNYHTYESPRSDGDTSGLYTTPPSTSRSQPSMPTWMASASSSPPSSDTATTTTSSSSKPEKQHKKKSVWSLIGGTL